MRRSIIAAVGLVVLGACTPSVFPYKALEGVNPNFDFSQCRMLPEQGKPEKIQLGGRILQAATQSDTLSIVAAQLPIATPAADGPEETEKSGGLFVILYGARVDPAFLQRGNRLMVVGQTTPPAQVEVNQTPQSLPTSQRSASIFGTTKPKTSSCKVQPVPARRRWAN